MPSPISQYSSAAAATRVRQSAWRQRLNVISRVCAALFGGYFAAHGATAFLTMVLPFARVDRVIAASLLSFAVWCGVAIYVFAVRTSVRAWVVPMFAGGVLLATALIFPGVAARP